MFHAGSCPPSVLPGLPTRPAFSRRLRAELLRLLAGMSERR